VLAADADRRRIERELHDGPQQDLVALAVNLQLARRLVDSDRAAAAALLDELREDVQEAIDGTRALAQRIYPPLLEAGGLGAALRAAAEGAGVSTEIRVAADAAWSAEITATVYLCFVEVLEHAAGEATVAVREEGNALLFEIAATADADVPHVKDHVEALGGQLAVTSDQGSLHVFGSLPLS
jgi:signal transduction histidine kinase